jgi:hypothetical protein
MPPSRTKPDGQKRLGKPYDFPSSSSKSDSRKVCLHIVKTCVTHHLVQTPSTVGSFPESSSLPSQLLSMLYQQPSIEAAMQTSCRSFAPYMFIYCALVYMARIRNIALKTLPGRSIPLKTYFFPRLPNTADDSCGSFNTLNSTATGTRQFSKLYTSKSTVRTTVVLSAHTDILTPRSPSQVAYGVHIGMISEYEEEILEYANTLEVRLIPRIFGTCSP